MKAFASLLGVTLLLAASGARAESKMAKKFDAGPAIAGNSDPTKAAHRHKRMKPMAHKKAM